MRKHLLCRFEVSILLLSGRAGFELVHKAAAAGIPLVDSVSAPSSLAIQVAESFGITLIAFLRADHLNIYSGTERIRRDSQPNTDSFPGHLRVREERLRGPAPRSL